jgi:hypothetical protein
MINSEAITISTINETIESVESNIDAYCYGCGCSFIDGESMIVMLSHAEQKNIHSIARASHPDCIIEREAARSLSVVVRRGEYSGITNKTLIINNYGLLIK